MNGIAERQVHSGMVGRKRDAERIKRDIAQQVKPLFSSKGYGATSMEDICQATGRSKGSLYYHFKSKDELFLHVLRLNMEIWVEKWQQIVAGLKTAEEKLFALAEHYADDFENPLMKASEEYMTSRVIDQAALEHMMEVYRMPYGLCEELLAQGMDEGEFRRDNPRDLMYILNSLFSGIGALYYELDMAEIRRLYRKGVETLLAGLRAK